ncbi:MAG: 4-hydroxy-tetrahydrodipicolinate synthase [Burkholderiales bacterium]|jgi:4-hydroxy-tetrahydrodipicolinate synthase|nr:4-hydroxy-tetrahydrodipicolinate synthase [Burkholderiales bacterium]
MLRGVITAIATPMRENGEIDFESLTNLVLFQIKNGIDALAVTGSTGENMLLSSTEKIAIISHVIKIAKGQTKIIVAFNDIATNFAIDWTKQLNAIDGIDYYLVTAPAYVRPTQEGLYQHFGAIAAVSTRPIILYNVPGRTSCDLDNITALKLARGYKNIVGIKDATGNIERAKDLFQNRQPGFAVYSGDDGTAAEFVLNGGDGVISVISNLFPGKFKELISSALSGNKLLVSEINNKLSMLYKALSLESNPVALKWALCFTCIIGNDMVRLPLLPLSRVSQEQMKIALMDVK